MHRVNLTSLPEIEQKSPGGKFHSYCRNVSVELGGARNTGTWGGGHPFDVQIRRIPPGAAICPYHSHLVQWEMFVVRSGEGTVRSGDATEPVRAGDVFYHPPGTPHQLTNTGQVDLEVFILADNPALDGCYYPDSDKWSLRPVASLFRMNPADYYDGEETPLPGLPPGPNKLPVAPAARPVIPLSLRKLHPDSLPWVPWESPKKTFRGTSKELSIALGAARHAPVGLGGHPFDLELSKLAPGECGCPFHSHAGQWELFLILEGEGLVRTPTGTETVKPGDVVLHPPGEAHQLRNTGTSELMFYLVADKPALDVCHYPDSNKWDLGSTGKYFRAVDVDYWAGEE